MKTQTTAVLLSALLCTTFAQDWFLNQKPLAGTPAPSNEFCKWVCTSPPQPNLNQTTINLYFNQTTNIIAFFNATAQVALVIDINNQIAATIQGDGTAIVIDIVKQVGVYLSASSNLTWHSQETIEVYLSKLVTLKPLLDASNAQHFTLTSVTKEQLQFIFKVLGNISVEIRITTKVADSLKTLLEVSQILVQSLTNPIIKQLLTTLNSGVIHVGGDLTQLMKILQAIINFIGGLNGGITGLIEAGVSFDFALFLEAGSGLQILINLLRQIGEKFDLGKLLGSLITDAEAIFTFFVHFNAGRRSGVDGITDIIYNLLRFLNHEIDIEAFFRVLIIFSDNTQGPTNYILELDGFREIITQQQQVYGYSIALTRFSVVIEEVLQGTFTVDGVDISKVIEILSAGITNSAQGGLEIVIGILLQITWVVQPSSSFPQFVLYLITTLNSTEGIYNLGQLVPSANITATNSYDLFSSIVKGVNWETIWSQGIWKGLTSLPVIGVILKLAASVLNSLSDGWLDLEDLLTADDSIVGQIKEFFEWVANVLIKKGGSSDAW